MIDVERLLILREVARAGSKAGAARALGLAEPTVAHHLGALERRAGVPLTARHGRVTRLTPAGEALLEHAEAIATSLASAERALQAHADLGTGRLRIASFTSFCAVTLPAPLAQFARRYPGIEAGLVETETDDALALLEAGEVDLVIGFADDVTPPPAHLPIRWLDHDEYLAVLPATHPLARRETVDIAALAEETWISGCQRCRAHLQALAHAGGFEPQIAFQTEDYVTVQRLVAERLGVAILPRMALAASPEVAGIVTVATAPTSFREVFLALPREATPAATAFAELLAPGGTGSVKGR
ncbi:LysR substrate-binding domain-containing protein [Demequina sp. NBRC 110056]|uniref:LysR substrate-binding domain-containing protein n=1 Tax=Demequina sp. NBRC 110056 TaxID=1570345 RepID=UPI0009FD8C25|nr:LysR substrate-binding domain-containing protein [Demequina sp. NBRC 110056]